jgi:hypothetical protein
MENRPDHGESGVTHDESDLTAMQQTRCANPHPAVRWAREYCYFLTYISVRGTKWLALHF